MQLRFANAFVFIFSLFVAGFAGTATHVHMLEGQGALQVDVADDPSYDYKVSLRNIWDFGWDGNNEADRI